MVNKNIIDVQNTKFIVTSNGFIGIDSTNPRAKLQIGEGNELSTNPILLQVADSLVVINDVDNKKRVGIGKYPEEDLDVNGNIQISSNGEEKITFFDTGHDHEHGKLLYINDGNGSQFEVFTKNATSGGVEQAFTINNKAAIGIGTNPNFGTDGQFLTSQGTNASADWITLQGGTGVNYNNGTISIGQDVSTTNSVTFNGISIGSFFQSTKPYSFGEGGGYIFNTDLNITSSTISIGTNANKGTPGQTIRSNGTNPIYWDSPYDNIIWTPYFEPFGLANIGGLVTMDNQTAYYSSFYTSSALSYDKIILYTTESTVSFTGHVGVAIFDSNNSSVGTNKLQEAIIEYTNAISSGQELLINFPNSVILNSNTKYWIGIAVDSSNTLGIAKSSSVNTDNIHIRKESSTNFTFSGFGSVVSTTNSDLNFWYRLYNSQVATFNDFTDLRTELSLFEINGSNVISKFTINNQGAFGLGTNPNFGTDGQVLTSKGTNTAIWGPPNKYYFYHSNYEPFGLGSLGGFVGMTGGDIYFSAFYTSIAVDYKKIILYTSEDFSSFIGNLGVAIYSDSGGPIDILFEHTEIYSSSPGIGSIELDLTLGETFSLNSNTKYWLGVAVDNTNFGTMGLAKSLITDTDNVHIRKGTGYTTATGFPAHPASLADSPLNFWFRLYNPDVTSFNQQTDSPDSLSIFKTNADILEAKIETETDVSGTGSSLTFKTLDDTGVLTRQFTINKSGAIGFGTNALTGTQGQILQSNGGATPTWTNQVVLPQALATTASPTFNNINANGTLTIDRGNNNTSLVRFITSTQSGTAGQTPTIHAGNIDNWGGDTRMGFDFKHRDGGENSATYTLFRTYGATSGNGFFQVFGATYSANGWNTSDDRFKHGEYNITNGLETIRKLVPQTYKKTIKMLEADNDGTNIGVEGEDWYWESGLIAQEIQKIPTLSKYVTEIDDKKYVSYNNIHIHTISAVKELDALVKTLEARIKTLESK